MKPFRYLRDPLFLTCFISYLVNRFILKPLLPWPFLHNSYNDFICIPFWIPIMLWLMRITRLRLHDQYPLWHEILIPLIVWSYVFEIYLPNAHIPKLNTVGDMMDVFWYTVGAFGSLLFWQRFYSIRVDKRENVNDAPVNIVRP